MRKEYTIMQRLKSLAGQHVAWNTIDSDKTFRFNSRTYTVEASIIGMQTKPRAGVNLTHEIIGMESMPGINSGYTGVGIVCFKAEPYLGSTHGALSGDVRGYEVSLGAPSGGGTISGVISGMKFINNCAKAPTGGVYMLYALTHGDVVPWDGLAYLPDDGQLAKYDQALAGATYGWIKVKIGTHTTYIQCRDLS
jgi:hypothetical protein